MLYPRPVRAFYKVNAQIVGVAALAIGGIAIVGLIVQWVMHR